MKLFIAQALLGVVFQSLALAPTAFASVTERLPSSVLKLIPAHRDLDDPSLRHAVTEIDELISLCGVGVFVGARNAQGQPEPNRCSYQVALDDLFFRAPEEKTGLLPDETWPYQAGTTWFTAPEDTTIPESFDIRDLMKNGQPHLKTQKCGDCWAWATHHGLELARAVHDERALDHSIQTVLSCSGAGSCMGGYMTAVGFLTHGLPMEADFPYAGSKRKCKYSSSDKQSGWEGKIIAAPYVGKSLYYSRGLPASERGRGGNKLRQMMAAMYQWKSPVVGTVSAYSVSGAGIVNSCKGINSGGNHMISIVGWETVKGKPVAHVWNSWGKSHGENGVSRIQWECGEGRLNRGLGVSARIVQYRSPCSPPVAKQTYLHQVLQGNPVEIGVANAAGMKCSWSPKEGLSDPNACLTSAKPDRTTEYHLTVSNECGSASSMTLVHVWGRDKTVLTPFGEVAYDAP